MNRLATIGALAATALGSSSARADEPLVRGEGYKLSEGLVLRSSASLEGGMVSNVFYEDRDPIAAGVLRIGGDVRIASRDGARVDANSTQRLNFDAGLGLGYREYIADNANARAQRDLDIDAFGNLVAFPEGRLSLVVGDTLTRKTRPTNYESSRNYNRIVNRFNAGADYHPGGRAMTFGVRYENTIDIFENRDAIYSDRIHHSGHLQASWRLLPVTKLFFDGSVGYFDTLGDDATLTKRTGTNMQAKVGLGTALTERTHARGHAGYTHTNYDEGENLSTVIGGLSLSHHYSPLGSARLAYTRAARDSINANFYTEHRIDGGLSHEIDRLVAGLGGDVRFRRYGGLPDVVGGEEQRRSDLILASRLSLQYPFGGNMSASLRYRVARVSSDLRLDTLEDDPDYVRHTVMAGVRADF